MRPSGAGAGRCQWRGPSVKAERTNAHARAHAHCCARARCILLAVVISLQLVRARVSQLQGPYFKLP